MRCIDCGLRIPKGRLRAVMHAKRCTKCQEETDAPKPASHWQEPPLPQRGPIDLDILAKACLIEVRKRALRLSCRDEKMRVLRLTLEQLRSGLNGPLHQQHAIEDDDIWKRYTSLKRKHNLMHPAS